jgi:hypothetical protein
VHKTPKSLFFYQVEEASESVYTKKILVSIVEALYHARRQTMAFPRKHGFGARFLRLSGMLLL